MNFHFKNCSGYNIGKGDITRTDVVEHLVGSTVQEPHFQRELPAFIPPQGGNGCCSGGDLGWILQMEQQLKENKTKGVSAPKGLY